MAKNNLQTALGLATQSEKQAIQQVIVELSIAMISIEKADIQPQIPTPSQRPESNQKVHEKLNKILNILQDQQIESTKTKRAVTNPQVSTLSSVGNRSGLKQAPPATHPPPSLSRPTVSTGDCRLACQNQLAELGSI